MKLSRDKLFQQNKIYISIYVIDIIKVTNIQSSFSGADPRLATRYKLLSSYRKGSKDTYNQINKN